MKYLYCIKGKQYWELAKISIRSLLKLSEDASVICIRDHENYDEKELEIFADKIQYIQIDGSDPSFPKISYRNNCFKQLIEQHYLSLSPEERIVVVDADVLWLKKPDETFNFLKRFDVWGQIVTPLNFFEYFPLLPPIEGANIGYRTLYNAKKNNICYKKYCQYRLNGGLYLISWDLFSRSIPMFVNQMKKIPVNKIFLSESLLTNCLLSCGGRVTAFDEDIKIKIRFPFFGKKAFSFNKVKNSIFYKFFFRLGKGEKIKIIYGKNKNCLYGRQIARHYMSGQKKEMVEDAKILLA